MNIGPIPPEKEQSLEEAHAAIKSDVREMIAMLNNKDTAEDGREFYTTRISSCRALEAERMGAILMRLDKMVNGEVGE